MARYLLVKIKDDSRRYDSPFAQARKALHDLSKKEDIALSDFGTDMVLVTEAERLAVARIFERVMERSRERQKMIDEIPRSKVQWPDV